MSDDTFEDHVPIRAARVGVLIQFPFSFEQPSTAAQFNMTSTTFHKADSGTSTLSAAIVGGSLGGLMSGIVLNRLGYSVTIYERADTMQDQGAGIVMSADTAAFLEKVRSYEDGEFCGEPHETVFEEGWERAG